MDDLAGTLPEGGELYHISSRYRMVLALPELSQHPESLRGLEITTLPSEYFAGTPLPAVAMIDPEGTVQGVGLAVNGAELVAFVLDGEHHGFGPAHPAEPPVAAQG